MINGCMLQYFHWYSSDDGKLWKHLKQDAKKLANLGISSIWLPPACKANSGGHSVGYDIYDLYDLGEFDQKGSIRTKYGTKQEYIDAINELHNYGIEAYADIVLNHKAGGDETELLKAIKVNSDDRNHFISEPYDIEAYTKFTFPGRQKKYSDFEWNHTCFSGVDYDHKTKETAIFTLLNDYGYGWDEVVGEEKGNYDYLMYSDIEFKNPAVREELKKWGLWYIKETQIDGFRLDAIKHITPHFYNEWLDTLRKETGKKLFAVGEYWTQELKLLEEYIAVTEGRVSLFDSTLHYNFYAASKEGNNYHMPDIFNNTLVSVNPSLAVTLTDNHDTQPLQALEAFIEPWFKPLAYALILLREAGYPCVFYPDLYGARYTDKGKDSQNHEINLTKTEHLENLLKIRKNLAYGMQRDYFDHGNCIGFTRAGDPEEENSGIAVLMSNGETGTKTMEIGKEHANQVFINALKKSDPEVIINKDGWGDFCCPPGNLSVWIKKSAEKTLN
jgi:alpha-amylase